MNKKSFLLGVLVGVLVTWALSFYLYYSLNKNEPSRLTKLPKNIFASDENNNSDELKISNGLFDNSVIGRPEKNFDDGKESHSKSKLKKEKWKISQKLIDELRPVTSKQFEEFGIIKSVEDQLTRDQGYKLHAFNILVSNHIGSFREIPDTRHKV